MRLGFLGGRVETAFDGARVRSAKVCDNELAIVKRMHELVRHWTRCCASTTPSAMAAPTESSAILKSVSPAHAAGQVELELT